MSSNSLAAGGILVPAPVPEAEKGAEELPASPKGFLEKFCASGSVLKTPSESSQLLLRRVVSYYHGFHCAWIITDFCNSSAFGRTVTASGHSNRSTRFIVQRWAGCFLPIRFRTVCAVNAQTWLNCYRFFCLFFPIPGFRLQNDLIYTKINIKVAESGSKWLKVGYLSPETARRESFQRGNASKRESLQKRKPPKGKRFQKGKLPKGKSLRRLQGGDCHVHG